MKKHFFKLATALFTVCQFSLFANIGPQGFHEFRKQYFVETGTYDGNGIQKALEAGFQQVRSIESDFKLFQGSYQRFYPYPNVRIYYGSSAVGLWDIIKDIHEPITFWLDAHIYPPLPNGGKNCPLIEELEQIKLHPIKTHTILIDDMHCCNSEAFDFLTQQDIIDKLLEINPDYQIYYVDGGDEGEYKNNVMVAAYPFDQ